jgi:predicted RNA-binding protein with PIN domain
MHLIIDGYNLLHVGRSGNPLSAAELQRERERLIDRLSTYRRNRLCDMTVVFDGWQSGWATEKRERQKGIDLIFSKLGEKADEVIKRMVKEKGAGGIVVTSDREIARFAEKISVPVVPSEQFLERMEKLVFRPEKEFDGNEEGDRGEKKKGPSRRLSKKERRAKVALKKL